MRTVSLALGLASALILVGCNKKESDTNVVVEPAPAMEAPPAEAAPAMEAPAMEAPAPEAAPAPAP